MNFQQILFSVLSVILTTIATWAVARITAWLDSKIKDKTALGFLNDAIQVVQTVVKEVYQTYVQGLKNKNAFDISAQKVALDTATKRAKSIMSKEVQDYIVKNYGDLTEWITLQIEAFLYDLKKKPKNDEDNKTEPDSKPENIAL